MCNQTAGGAGRAIIRSDVGELRFNSLVASLADNHRCAAFFLIMFAFSVSNGYISTLIMLASVVEPSLEQEEIEVRSASHLRRCLTHVSVSRSRRLASPSTSRQVSRPARSSASPFEPPSAAATPSSRPLASMSRKNTVCSHFGSSVHPLATQHRFFRTVRGCSSPPLLLALALLLPQPYLDATAQLDVA